MKISKAFIMTILLLIFEAVVHLLSYSILDTKSNPENLDHILGGTMLVARLTAYLLLFYFFWKPNARISSHKPKNLSLNVIFFLFLIILGTEFLNRPFADLGRIFRDTPADFRFNGFSILGIYRNIAALVLAPVLEELFFRKFLLQKLVQKYTFLTGLVVSSLLFSLIHWETPLNLVPAFIMGIISGIIYLKTGKIFYSVLLHFLYNASSVAIAVYAAVYSDWLNWLDFGILYWVLFALGILLTLFAVRQIPSEKGEITTEHDH